MSELTLSDHELQVVQHERYHHPEPAVQRHCTILALKHHAPTWALTHDDLATLAGCARSTVQRTLARYRDGGLEPLRQVAVSADPNGALEQQRPTLAALFQQQPPHSVAHARQQIEQHTGIRRGLTQVRHFLHRLGLQPRKVAAIPVPPKLTVAEHAAQQNIFLEQQLEPRLAAARAGQRQLYFVDAAHFVWGTFLGTLWCVVRWCCRAATGRQRYNVLGALDARTHRLLTVSHHSYINATTVGDLLRAVAAALPGVPLTLVLDNARYQKCALVQDLARTLGIELL